MNFFELKEEKILRRHVKISNSTLPDDFKMNAARLLPNIQIFIMRTNFYQYDKEIQDYFFLNGLI